MYAYSTFALNVWLIAFVLGLVLASFWANLLLYCEVPSPHAQVTKDYRN